MERLEGEPGGCPFCARDPYHYVDIGVGMERVAVICCDEGIAYFQHGDPVLTEQMALRREAATALRALSDRCDALIGFAAHDDDCTVNRYPGHDACSCGLSLILQQARHDPVSDPRQTVDPTIRDFRIVAEPPAGEE